jgi:hypothetical protein
LPSSLARQLYLAALPGRLARQPCPVAFAWQPCPVSLPASLARQPCPAALQKSLQAVLCSIAYFYSAGSLVQAFPAIKDIAILSLVYELISTCQRG